MLMSRLKLEPYGAGLPVRASKQQRQQSPYLLLINARTPLVRPKDARARTGKTRRKSTSSGNANKCQSLVLMTDESEGKYTYRLGEETAPTRHDHGLPAQKAVGGKALQRADELSRTDCTADGQKKLNEVKTRLLEEEAICFLQVNKYAVQYKTVASTAVLIVEVNSLPVNSKPETSAFYCLCSTLPTCIGRHKWLSRRSQRKSDLGA